MFVSCLREKWEELDLEAERINSSASPNCCSAREWENGILSQPWLWVVAEGDFRGSVCSSHPPGAFILPVENPKCVGKHRVECGAHIPNLPQLVHEDVF